MRLRSFTAATMKAALDEVKEALGEQALILATEERPDGVSVTAAVDADAEVLPTPSPKTRTGEKRLHSLAAATSQVDTLRYDVQHHLRTHNLPEFFVSKMTARLGDAEAAAILGKRRLHIANESRYFLQLALEHISEKTFRFSPLSPTPHTLMLVGTPGAGKTLMAAKIATRLAMAKRHVLLITTDTHRAGGAQQLQAFADILGVPLTICADVKALADALKHAGRGCHVIIDTAGCNPYLEDDLSPLVAYADLPGVQTALVMPAGMDAQEAIDTAESFAALPLTRLIATRVDCTRRFGGILAASAAHTLPLCLAGDSSSVADAPGDLNAKTLVQILLKPL